MKAHDMIASATSSILKKPIVVVNGRKFRIQNEIGEGAFAFVYHVYGTDLNGEKISCALKKVICMSDEQLHVAMKEIRVLTTLRKLKCPHVLHLIENSIHVNAKNQKEVFLLSPLYMGNVQNVIDRGCDMFGIPEHRGYPYCSFVDGLDVVQILRHCTEGLEALHQCGYRHADLKPANILLQNNFHAVLADFGSASEIPQFVNTRAEGNAVQEEAALFTTASYRSPELFETPSRCILGGESDIWSFGCTMYSIFFSRNPFETSQQGFSKLAAVTAQFSFPKDHPWPTDYIQVIKDCLQVDSSHRPNIQQLHLRLKRLSSPPLDLSPSSCSQSCADTDAVRRSSLSALSAMSALSFSDSDSDSSFSGESSPTNSHHAVTGSSESFECCRHHQDNDNDWDGFADFTFMEVPVISEEVVANDSEVIASGDVNESFGEFASCGEWKPAQEASGVHQKSSGVADGAEDSISDGQHGDGNIINVSSVGSHHQAMISLSHCESAISNPCNEVTVTLNEPITKCGSAVHDYPQLEPANLSRVTHSNSMGQFLEMGATFTSNISHAASSTSDGENSCSESHSSDEHSSTGWVQVDHAEVEVQRYRDYVSSQLGLDT